MFIRWKRRKKVKAGRYGAPRRHSDKGDSLYCVLVESQRVNGSPRQKVISYLGSVDEGDRERLGIRVNFWDRVVAKLDQLKLQPVERTKIEEAIALMVSRASEDEAATFRKERDEYRKAMVALFRSLRR